MEAKHVIFFLGLFAGVPILAVILNSNLKYLRWGVFLLIFSIPFIHSIGIGLLGDPMYRGTSRGFEIALPDLLALSLLFSIIIKKSKLILIPKGTYFYFIYFLFSAISIINAGYVIYSFYEILKMILAYIFFISIYNYIYLYKDFRTILYSFSVLILYNLILMLYQKYKIGFYQPSGLFTHRNSTSMFINLVAPIFLSFLLQTKVKEILFYFFFFTYSICALTVVLALSRGAIFFFPVSSAIVASFSIAAKVTRRKVLIISIFFIIAVTGSFYAAPMVADRFENASERSKEGRILLAHTAIIMANDKFFGIGLNNWSLKASYPYTYTNFDDLNVPNPEEYKRGIVETTYLLVAAECGWIGLVSLLCWLGYYFINNIINIFIYKETDFQYMPIGIFAGLFAVLGQSTLEWVLKQTPNFYELMLIFAIIAAMTQNYQDYKKIKNSPSS